MIITVSTNSHEDTVSVTETKNNAIMNSVKSSAKLCRLTHSLNLVPIKQLTALLMEFSGKLARLSTGALFNMKIN